MALRFSGLLVKMTLRFSGLLIKMTLRFRGLLVEMMLRFSGLLVEMTLSLRGLLVKMTPRFLKQSLEIVVVHRQLILSWPPAFSAPPRGNSRRASPSGFPPARRRRA